MNASPSSPDDAPLVSVVVPAYNAAKYLEETLQSVRAQSLENWECIVVDDGSSDETATVARKMADLDGRIRLVQQQNQGVSVARNSGFSASNPQSTFVAFLDADDLWEAQTLEILVRTLREHEEVVACHCNAFYIDGDGHRIHEGVLEASSRSRFSFDGRRVINSRAQDPTTFAAAVTNCPIITPGCALMRREAFHQIGGFASDLSTVADWDFWIHLTRLSDLIFVDEALLAYRRHNSNMSTDRRSAIAEVRKLRSKAIDSPDNSPEQRQTAKRAYRAFYWYQARRRYRATIDNAFKPAPKDAAQNLALALANTAMAIKGRP